MSEWIEFRKSRSNFLATCVREKEERKKESWLVKATLLFLVDPDKFRLLSAIPIIFIIIA